VTLTPQEQQVETSFHIFFARHPECPCTEPTMRAMLCVVQSEGLDARIPESLEFAYLKVRPATQPAPAPAPEPEDTLAQAARALIESYGGESSMRAFIANLSSSEWAQRINNPVWVRADELVNPRTATPLVTLGDASLAAAKRENAQHAAVAASARAVSAGYANYKEPAPQAEGGIASPSGMSFGDRRAAAPRRKTFTKEELQRNEAANRARSGEPEQSRADAILEAAKKRRDELNLRWGS
jgi:hypothetical protein